jgi:hypothetical protein
LGLGHLNLEQLGLADESFDGAGVTDEATNLFRHLDAIAQWISQVAGAKFEAVVDFAQSSDLVVLPGNRVEADFSMLGPKAESAAREALGKLKKYFVNFERFEGLLQDFLELAADRDFAAQGVITWDTEQELARKSQLNLVDHYTVRMPVEDLIAANRMSADNLQWLAIYLSFKTGFMRGHYSFALRQDPETGHRYLDCRVKEKEGVSRCFNKLEAMGFALDEPTRALFA